MREGIIATGNNVRELGVISPERHGSEAVQGMRAFADQGVDLVGIDLEACKGRNDHDRHRRADQHILKRASGLTIPGDPKEKRQNSIPFLQRPVLRDDSSGGLIARYQRIR
jgi:hypothetical protein